MATLLQLPRIHIDSKKRKRAPHHASQWAESLGWYLDYDAGVKLSTRAVAELLFWTKRGDDWNGAAWSALSRYPQLILNTDACGKGWGATVHTPGGDKPPSRITFTQGAFAPSEVTTHSAHTEPLALLLALYQLSGTLQGKCVRHRTDSLTTFYMIKNGGGVSASSFINNTARRIWLLCLSANITLQTEYIGSEGIIRAGADCLSRTVSDVDVRLHRTAFYNICRRFGNPAVDVFASRWSAQKVPEGSVLPYFSSDQQDLQDNKCLGVDALAASWPSTKTLYLFPPLYMVFKTIEKLRTMPRVRALLVVPNWPSQPWFPWILNHTRHNIGAASACCYFGREPSNEERELWSSMDLLLVEFTNES